MSVFVACSLPAGLIITHGELTFRLNGPHVGVDLSNLPRNGFMPDSPDVVSGFGLTTLEGEQADAFKEWVKEMTCDPSGKKLPEQRQFAPIAKGAIKWSENAAETRKEVAKSSGMSISGLDPDKDLPTDVETSEESKAAATKK